MKFPVAQQQIAAVARWVREHSTQLDIHRDRIALGGDSAGGNLAITAALRLRDEGDAKAIHAIVTNYAVTDIYSTPEATGRSMTPCGGCVRPGDHRANLVCARETESSAHCSGA